MPIIVTCDSCGGPDAFNYPAGSGPPYLCRSCHAKRDKPYNDRQRLHTIMEKSEVYRRRTAPLVEAQRALQEARADLKAAESREAAAYMHDDWKEYDRMLYRHNESHRLESDPRCLACQALRELGLPLAAGIGPEVE